MLRRTVCDRRRIDKLMVANRGEIACRVFRTCRDLHIHTVALFCEAERNAKHVTEADEAICIGPPPATHSYLRGDKIIEVAKRLSVDAIHPGYGFLSENAQFAEAVTAMGIEFIGPPASAIMSMGSKSESKKIMEAASVPVVPGYYGDDQEPARLASEADKVGYPVLIKAVSGGGGKGMKIVERKEDFEMLLQSAKREATNFFKDDRVILERYIMFPRHIECQIFCDKFGEGVFFFERDCSVQRRYQKVLEEAPAPHLSAEMRHKIGEVALKAAKAVGYVGAGTVEFIFDTSTGEFFFMEMNTRLQVEHPVTEEVCRIRGAPLDLVRLQILTAMGEPLGFSQSDITLQGSCIEARVYAESPENGFLPESGPLTYIKEPVQGIRGGAKIRLDTGFRQGDNVLIHYDPMISKLIVWGKEREEALRGLRDALDGYHIAGINSNIEFLKKCCDAEDFIKGGVTTNFIAQHQDALLQQKSVPSHVAVLAAVARLADRCPQLAPVFRLHSLYTEKVAFQCDGGDVVVTVTGCSGDGLIEYETMGTRGTVCIREVSRTSHRNGVSMVAFFEDGMRYSVTAIASEREATVVLQDEVYKLPYLPLADGFGDASMQTAGSSKVVSPMPGKVAKLMVHSGDMVTKGQVLLILEAMKMEHPVRALRQGTVTFSVSEGDMVNGDQSMGLVMEAT